METTITEQEAERMQERARLQAMYQQTQQELDERYGSLKLTVAA